ncbi:MAG: hypothetical protein Q8N53_00020, partial [Longimicrobiales bacterium]|nr:hypothetical protein [Longimicrobiales bacterium]
GRQGLEPTFINREGSNGLLCYATSKDGIHWEKPDLGLIEFGGSKHNNLVRLGMGERPDLISASVLYDPEDPDPSRRFKVVAQPRLYRSRFAVAFSPDGFEWTPSPRNPVGPWLELCGLTKIGDCYFLNGQATYTYQFGPTTRRLSTFCSYDFETWSSCPAPGLNRTPLMMGPLWEDQENKWEEIHMGAGLWNRGNVILGIYGQWHGIPSGDRRQLTMDLGFAITHDGLHFVEPIPNFPMVQAAEERDLIPGFAPALMQGQAFANLGDKTYHWYSCWRRDGQVRLATWDRDRLGYLQLFRLKAPGEVITCPIQVSEASGKSASVYVNADGLGEWSELTVEVLDREFRPVPGFSGEDCLPVRESGLRVPIVWRGGKTLPSI